MIGIRWIGGMCPSCGGLLCDGHHVTSVLFFVRTGKLSNVISRSAIFIKDWIEKIGLKNLRTCSAKYSIEMITTAQG